MFRTPSPRQLAAYDPKNPIVSASSGAMNYNLNLDPASPSRVKRYINHIHFPAMMQPLLRHWGKIPKKAKIPASAPASAGDSN
jgi:hypothetical protein